MKEHCVSLPDAAPFSLWRLHARPLLAAGIAPDRVVWRSSSEQDDLFSQSDPLPETDTAPSQSVSKECLNFLETLLCHANPEKFALAYRILWRSRREHSLLKTGTDPDVATASRMTHQISREIHKMKAFVRFREKTSQDSNTRHFAAWFEPEHHILEKAAPFFARRFTDMNWMILTPKGSIGWDGESCVVTREACTPALLEDEAESLWKVYYRSIFNPARVKVKAMRSEMSPRYWKNLPETELIPEMLAQATRQRW
ncbi:TIGR03915 family putative DNA repair protein [Acetobacter sp.]|jgi:DNA polymerase|uniref:TIGR03915 family putative DNA repair protein n=1 Tax=Acetobacter sp. TaxID=440 RepID=UPI0025C692F8|nr:TIGR03915 family putative DNA repair protein [Acetobacter sp.]MCH4090971.1 TIGR03915 family putative DNA repair protein [Acetobacter sp.]MCI1300812.1 TIGR03915 family putative DNA repair protein [Acetobacter sp.]MCI1317083.1 TIGR03915 family putative DNA repair protein [Acetobacter sp.]